MGTFTYLMGEEGKKVTSSPELNSLLQRVRNWTQADFRILEVCHIHSRLFRKNDIFYNYTLVLMTGSANEAEIIADSGRQAKEVTNYLRGILTTTSAIVNGYIKPQLNYGFKRGALPDLNPNFVHVYCIFSQAFLNSKPEVPREIQQSSRDTARLVYGVSSYPEADDFLEELYLKYHPTVPSKAKDPS